MRDLPAVTLLGTVNGLQAALLAVGLVLVYRAARFINFAQAQMGSIAASVLAVAVFDFDLPYPVALAGALVAGAATGAAIERLLGWRLFDKSRLALLVASIGIAQLLLMASIVGPLALDQGRLSRDGYPQPFDLHWRVGSFVLDSSQVTTLVVGPIIAVALLQFLARTRTGRAIRGAASNPDAARLSGVSVRRISLVVWVLASLVSSLAAILYAPSQPSLGFAAGASVGLLLRGLAAALLAGMGDFRLAFVGGLVLGVVEQYVLFYTDVTGLADLSVVLTLVVGLVLRARVLERDIRTDDGLTNEVPDTPVPARVSALFVVRHAGRIAWTVLFAVLLLLPQVQGLRTQERAVFLLFIISFAMVGLGLTVLTGWAGQVSLGQYAVLGVGAYAAAFVHEWDLGLPVMFLFAGAIGAGVSVLVGAVAVRFRGLFLGVVTLGFAFAARSWLFRQSWVVGDETEIADLRNTHLFNIEVATARSAYVVGVVVLALTVLGLRSLRASGVGRALIAVRDNADAAASYGMNPTAVKLMALGVSGFVTGIGGALWGMASQSWNFSTFDPSLSFVMVAIVVVGGLGTLHGPILGAFAVFAWPYLVPDANTPQVRALTSGLLLLVALLFFPGGLASVLTRVRDALFALAARALPESGFGPRPDSTPLVASDISISFGGIQALSEVSIHVEPGEILGLIGGNGAGKSTLINCISGHLVPDEGRVVVAGRDLSGLPPEYRPFVGLSRTFQDARLFPGLTLTETVMAAMDRTNRSGAVGAMVGAPWVRWAERVKRQQAVDILDAFGLGARATSRVGELSTGMRRVLDLAAVVATEPTVVLLDEPTAGLAQREVEAFAPLLRRLRDEFGASVVIVEHDMPLLMSLCDRIYYLEQGRVVTEGSPRDVRADPRVIAGYLGTEVGAVERSNGHSGASRGRVTHARAAQGTSSRGDDG